MTTRIITKIETSRLLLKILDESYGQALLDYLIKNKTFFTPWTPRYTKDFYNLNFQVKILKEKQKLMEEEKEFKFHFFNKENSNCIIGDIGFSNIIKGTFMSCHLGYKIDKDEIRKGYMTEALNAAIEHMFGIIKLHRIEANVMPRNLPSIKLLENLGFQNEGLSKKYLKVNGLWEDHLHFVLLNESVE